MQFMIYKLQFTGISLSLSLSVVLFLHLSCGVKVCLHAGDRLKVTFVLALETILRLKKKKNNFTKVTYLN